ncbi:hypothetical protein [Halobacteriovorax sp. JY17]|uniref:hypothetical protein n=1 Tax=Halobacteriovorax sp. JY17 TaxID=2014617 RepID=UPI000C5223F0|nr:hypothetical protein [Halobacteriovorax sp. JY17]PIK15099.1 MAG: hypothetical protein CES88_12255 [Halobacteriovorax sp. JY17]
MENLDKLTYVSVIILGIGGIFLGGTVLNGVFVGAMSTLGIGMLLFKLRKNHSRTFNLIIEHNIISDIVLSSLLVFIMGTSTVTSIISGASAALFCSAGLSYLSRYLKGVHNMESYVPNME